MTVGGLPPSLGEEDNKSAYWATTANENGTLNGLWDVVPPETPPTIKPIRRFEEDYYFSEDGYPFTSRIVRRLDEALLKAGTKVDMGELIQDVKESVLTETQQKHLLSVARIHNLAVDKQERDARGGDGFRSIIALKGCLTTKNKRMEKYVRPLEEHRHEDYLTVRFEGGEQEVYRIGENLNCPTDLVVVSTPRGFKLAGVVSRRTRPPKAGVRHEAIIGVVHNR